MTSATGDRPLATAVRVAREASAVTAVRRFVDEVLTRWGHRDLVDDVALSVTELATNATLHTDSSYLDVELSLDEAGVRVAVVNAGTVPAESIAARAVALPRPPECAADIETMTGRGLFIVAALAHRWGIDDVPQGTRVWADFVRGHEAAPQAPLVGTRPGQAPPPSGLVVRLRRCPTRLLAAHDDQLADLVRDLSLYAVGRDGAAPGSGRQVLEVLDVLKEVSRCWDGARQLAAQARRDGRGTVDVDLPVGDPAAVPRLVRGFRNAVAVAEGMATDGLLISLPAPPKVRIWRAWVAEEMTRQAAVGGEPRPFDEFSWPA
ncbi:MAG: ATP-binding protein [Nocardioidaceae bacterium]